MLDVATRNLLDTLAGKLLQSVDHHSDEGNTEAALMVSDAAEGVLALLDADGAHAGVLPGAWPLSTD